MGVLQEKVDPKELIQLCAVDHELFGRTFFPRAFRQASPPFLRECDRLLWSRNNRFVALKLFRGSSKTTRLRVFTSKRIAYGLSHTILYISRSQGHSVKSVEWLKNAVDYNLKYSSAFGLRPGSKWTGEEIEIIHSVDEYPIRVIALGITGQIRGFNVEDFRPDLIIVDDPDSEETTANPEQRVKTSELFFGAIAKSLSPRSESPDAKMVIAQTPLEREDLIETCCADPDWASLTQGCFGPDGESIWEERFFTQDLINDKAAHVRRNQLSLWLREMECTISSREQRAFDTDWLQHWDTLPPGMAVYMAIDPASSEAETADFQAIAVVGFYGSKTFLIEYSLSKGKNPEEIGAEFMRLLRKWKPVACIVETTSYQRVLAWFLRQVMARHNHFITIHEKDDRRKKSDRIIQALSGRCSNEMFYIKEGMTEFLEQYAQYPASPSKSYRGKDDLLDAIAMAITFVSNTGDIEGEYSVFDEDIPVLEHRGYCP
jgi:Terminase RNaseH-like domain